MDTLTRQWSRELTESEKQSLHQNCDWCHISPPTHIRFYNDGTQLYNCAICTTGGA